MGPFSKFLSFMSYSNQICAEIPIKTTILRIYAGISDSQMTAFTTQDSAARPIEDEAKILAK
jgi:hypothetical protein